MTDLNIYLYVYPLSIIVCPSTNGSTNVPLEYIYICDIYTPIIHNCVSRYKWNPPPMMAGAPQPKNVLRLQTRVLHGGSAETRSMAGAPTLCSSGDVSMRDPHRKVMLSGRTSHTHVESFCPELNLSGGYGDLAYVMLCNTLVLWAWSVIKPGVSSRGTSNSTILPQ